MDLIDRLKELADRAKRTKVHLTSEEATKTSLVLPFIQVLGYDIFNPEEVQPEFTADVGLKKGEKVDYAILQDGKPIMLFECKCYGTDLREAHFSQLYRYFAVTSVRVGVVTNGVDYQFYSDLDSPNKMDSKPFLEFTLTDINEAVIAELKKFTKASFNLDTLLTGAAELKYTKAVKQFLAEQLADPSYGFVRLCAAEVYSGLKTTRVIEQFKPITRAAFAQLISDRLNETLKNAMSRAEPSEPATREAPEEDPASSPEPGADVVTTVEELEAFYIVKSILREVVEASRIFQRDTKSYFTVLLDDTNRKTVCRLRFNERRKRLGLLDADKNETIIELNTLDDIFAHADQLRQQALHLASS